MTAPDVSITSLTLTWTPAVPTYGVTEYQLFQDDLLIATVGGEVITYEVTGLESDTQYAFKVEACDAAGNGTTDGPSVMVRTLTSVEATERLIDDVAALDLPKSFVGKLNDAIKVLTDANPNNDGAACNKLNDFIDQVNGEADKISDAGGNPAALIAKAEAIIAMLNST